MNMEPGPVDPSVLLLQLSYRSPPVWNEHDTPDIHCRCRLAMLHPEDIDPRIEFVFIDTGFIGIVRVGFISMDHAVIQAFIERWRQETHTFHLPNSETTITLQDVNILLGLPVDGLPVTGTTKYHWPTVVSDFLGVEEIPESVLEGSRCSMTWLVGHFKALPEGAYEVVIHQHVQAYILLLLGGTLFLDKSGSFIRLMFLPLLGDIRRISCYSWGSACLAWLYRELCRACHAGN